MQLHRNGSASLLFALAALSGCGDGSTVASESAPGGSGAATPAERGIGASPTGETPAAGEAGGGAVQVNPFAQVWIGRAFDVAAIMPTVPHRKTRGRLQAELVIAGLAAGLEDEAPELANRIEGWRRGEAQAAVAVHRAKAGDEASARAALAVAAATEASLTEESVQGWRRDRVRVGIAEAHAHLGDVAEAAMIQAAATPSEAGRLAPLSVTTVANEDAEKQLTVLEEIARTSDLEQRRFALLAMAEFYGRFHADKVRRKQVEERLRASWTELPIQPRLDILERLVEFDLAAGDTETARFTVDEMASMVEENRWNPEEGVALRAKVARLLARADEPKAARRAADDALTLFDASAEEIVSIWRGRALRPLAEAYAAMGHPITASAMYERALDEAVVNPNGRPRLEDLVATVISISRTGIEPSEALEKKLSSTVELIGEPW